MRRLASSLTILALISAAQAFASAIEYRVNVDSSSIFGDAGSLDFNFNPGPLVTQGASLRILGFSGNGAPDGAPTVTGDVTGALPATLTFDNASSFNDYFSGFTFGTNFTFDISLYGPALSAPDGVSTSGSAFAFSIFSDIGGTVPALTTDTTDGFAVTVAVNLDGTTTLTNFSPETSITPVTATPEPASSGMLIAFTLIIGSIGLKRRVAHRPYPR